MILSYSFLPKKCIYYNIANLMQLKCRYSLFKAAQTIAPNITMFLPRNMDLNQVEQLSWLSCPPLDVEVLALLSIHLICDEMMNILSPFHITAGLTMQIEKNYVQSYLKGITVYFGDFAFQQLRSS